ncbi:hypothetical protein ZIOFF_030500 [Zingiber officinale]|uniref:Reverse transcriptase Ty1/copia-type domain-containing protein n=1 Tax=Zingiber officinale TaxID=94328 RepID=A0A8J5H4G1_ZINOF|nr:hypothetical protein ZIOFF_030500 [Zingiber officinale]
MDVAPTDSAQGDQTSASDSGHGNLNLPTQGGAKLKLPSDSCHGDLNPPTQGGVEPKLPFDSGQADLNLPTPGGAKPNPKPPSDSSQADLNSPTQGCAKLKPNPPKTDAIVVTGGPKDIADGDVNISQKLSSVLLNEFNYLPWSRAITIALGGRSRLGFINGTFKSPESSSPEYAAWLSKDQQVMSWILNSMEHDLAAIFSYSESSLDLWNAVRDMYGNQNNSARIFQIHREIASLQQDGKPFVNLLGSLKSLWSELEIYRPPTTDAATLQKRTEEDRIFQLLASLNPDFEDLRSHILMNTDLPSFKNICATIQREEVRRKVMPRYVNTSPSDVRAYITRSSSEEKSYKGKRPDLKCEHCHSPGHSINRCWTLHPELKPKFSKDQKSGGYQKRIHDQKAHMATHSLESFSSNPVALLNDFANYLQNRHGQETVQGRSINQEKNQPAALLSHFAGFLADANSDTNEGIQIAFLTAFEINSLHDVWVIDSGATDHMSNKLTHVYDFHPFSKPSLVSVANGKGAHVQGKGKIKLVSDTIESDVLYVPSFPFQLLSVHKLTSSLNCEVLFTPHKVIFQDLVTKATIGEGFHLHGLYYFSPNSQVTKGFQAISFPIAEQDLWHRRLTHPSNNVLSKINRVLPKGTDKAPDLSHLKIFGCTCFVHVQTGHRDKLDPRAVKCIFLGYSQTQKGYKCFDFLSKKLYVTRDVRFAEQIPYFTASSQGEKLSELFPLPNINYGHQSTQDLHPQDLHPSHATSEHCDDHLDISSALSKEAIIESPEQDFSHTQGEPIASRRNPPRVRHPPTKLEDYVAHTVRSSADSSLYVRLGSVDKLVVLIYVDDLIITGNNNDSIAQLKMQLQQKFPIKDLGSLKYFLGIEMETSRKGLFLNQRKYILDLLQDAEMLHTKPAATPLDSKLRLASTEKALDSPSYYQKLVGKLIYLTITRPDIMFALGLWRLGTTLGGIGERHLRITLGGIEGSCLVNTLRGIGGQRLGNTWAETPWAKSEVTT